MRKPIVIFCAVISVFCLWLLLHRTVPIKNSPVEVQAAQTNQPSANQIPATPAQTIQSIGISKPSAASLAEAEARYRSTPEGSNAFRQRVLADWQKPIDFYGKVVDENTNPVAGANVTFKWTETPSEDGNRLTDAKSDVEGLFSLTGAKGPGLTVLVNKEGYYTSKSTTDSFQYALANDIFHPDQLNPVIFYLRKKGQGIELITSENGIRSDVWLRVPKDNTPVQVDFFQKKASANGQLEIKQIKPPFQGATNWSFSLSIPDGGLVENQDEFQFEAPEIGYQPTIEYNFIKDDPDWTTQVTKQFYISFGNPRKYGWLRIESNLAQETIFLTYAINPDGSRNLEPK